MKAFMIFGTVLCLAIPVVIFLMIDRIVPGDEPAAHPQVEQPAANAPVEPKGDLPPKTISSDGLIVETMVVGSGAGAVDGDQLSMHYTGWTDGFDGKLEFDSSRKPGGAPFGFTLGMNQVIKGWDRGAKGMKVGEIRRITVPPELGYGLDVKPKIPANSTLYFLVELAALRPRAAR